MYRILSGVSLIFITKFYAVFGVFSFETYLFEFPVFSIDHAVAYLRNRNNIVYGTN